MEFHGPSPQQSCEECKTSPTPTLCSSQLADFCKTARNIRRWCCKYERMSRNKLQQLFSSSPENAIFGIWQRAISIVDKVFERTLSCFQHTHAFDSADNSRKIICRTQQNNISSSFMASFISTSLTSTFQCRNSKASTQRRVDESVVMQLLVDIFSVRHPIPHHLFDFDDSLRHMTVS